MWMNERQSPPHNQGFGETKTPSSDLEAGLDTTSAPASKVPLMLSYLSPQKTQETYE